MWSDGEAAGNRETNDQIIDVGVAGVESFVPQMYV